MNILVDHGWRSNLGDGAQVEGAVSRLLELFPDITITTFYQESPSWMWREPRIKKHEEYSLQPFLAPLSNIFLKSNASPATSRVVLPFLDAPLKPGAILVHSGNQVLSADEFCRPFDAFYIPGGGFLTDVFQKDLARKCLLMMTFASQRKAVILTGQQLGPFCSRLNKRALLRAIRKVDFIGLREPAYSPDYCREAGLPQERYGLMGDDLFGTKPVRSALVEDVLYRHGLAGHHFIAINVRMARHYTGGVETYLKKLCTLFDRLAEVTGMPLFFIPISLDPLDGELDTASKLSSCMNTHFAILNKPDLTPALVKGILAQAWGAVGISYHFCTFSLSQGVPAVCLYSGDYYNQKGKGLAEFWRDERIALSLEDLEPDFSRHSCPGILSGQTCAIRPGSQEHKGG